MKHLPLLLVVLTGLLISHTALGQTSFNGYWVTQTFSPINTPAGVLHQKMLLNIQPLPGSNDLYRLYYYVWTKDFAQVSGPNFENGVLDPETGWIYMGGAGKNRDFIKLENGRMFYFLKNNLAGSGKSSILNLMKVDDQTGLQLEAIVKKKK